MAIRKAGRGGLHDGVREIRFRSETEAMPPTKYTVLSLFSGGMGLDVGLAKTGRFNLMGCVEKQHAFCETIRMNERFGRLGDNVRIVEADIKTVDPKRLREELSLEQGSLDLLAGGPPCQSFSTAGKRASVEDPRGTLLWDYLRFVAEFQPKFFLMENVRGLMSAALKHRPIRERPEHGGPALEPDELPGSVVRLFATICKSCPESTTTWIASR